MSQASRPGSLIAAGLLLFSLSLLTACDAHEVEPDEQQAAPMSPQPSDRRDSDTSSVPASGTAAEEADAVCVDRPAHPDRTGGEEVIVYFFCDSRSDPATLRGVLRPVPEGSTQLEAAIGSLLEGPTEEERGMGYLSTIATYPQIAVDTVSLYSGRAVVSFSSFPHEVDREHTSFLRPGLMAELTWTVYLHDADRFAIDAVTFDLGGDCHELARRLGYDECLRTTREDWERI